MKLLDLQFILDPLQRVSIEEYDTKTGLFNYRKMEWYKVNGMNREVVSIFPYDDYLVIEVKKHVKSSA